MQWHLNYLALAVPFFIGFILLEYAYSQKKGLPYFNINRTVANISIGIAERLCDVLVAGYFFFIYEYLQTHYGIFTIKASWSWWIVLFLATDLIWYWYHRLAHEWNIFWAVHVVHHQSEDFNYSVSARITVLQALVRTVFWCVLPIIGFPAPMIFSLLLLHGLYPFFIHTQTIGKLGILEYILVTPSHHRVHHASDEVYLDKNYGDVLIIWDKLFGTFQKEEHTPTYGLTKQLNSYSFLWQHFHFFIELILAMKQRKGLLNKIKLLFEKPDAIDPNLREKAAAIFKVQSNEENLEHPLHKYVIVQMIVLLMALAIFIMMESYAPLWFKISFALFIVLTLINCGAIMEQKAWVFRVELGRLSVVLVSLLIFPQYFLAKTLLMLTLMLVFAYFYKPLKNRYLSYLYNYQ